MPRTSAEERASSFYRAARKPLSMPKGLTARARVIWCEIIDSKPADWFDGGSAGLLADHCRVQARMEAVWMELVEIPVSSDQSAKLTNQYKILRSAFAASCRHLRLDVQHSVEWHAAKNGEVAIAAPDQLLGGLSIREKIRAIG